MEQETQPKKDTKKIYILLGVIVLLIGTNIFLWMQKDKTETRFEQTTDEKAKLQVQLNELEKDLTEATANADSLNESLIAKDEELKAKVAQLQTALRRGNMSAAELERARNEIDQLRYYIRKYQDEITTLKKENELLASENSGLKKTVESEQRKSSDLINQNINLSNKVAVASLLKANSISAMGVRYRSNGKEVESNRVKSLERIKVSFNVADNQVAVQGPRDFYLRVINPAGKAEVVTDASDSKFTADGEEMQYSAKSTVNFENKAGQTYTMFWKKSSAIEPGEFTLIIYADGASIGSTKITLK
jgi:cell division protein FtsB